MLMFTKMFKCMFTDIGLRGLEEELVVPVTPNMLLLGKTSSAPNMSNSYEVSMDRFTERLGFIEQVEEV